METAKKLRYVICFSLALVITNFLLYYTKYDRLHAYQRIVTHVQMLSIRGEPNGQENNLRNFDWPVSASDAEVVNYIRYKAVTNYTLNYKHEQIMKWISVIYPKFNMTEPNFATPHHRKLFYLMKSNSDVLGVSSSEQLVGQIYVIRNGSFTKTHDCGFKSNISNILDNSDVFASKRHRSVLPLLVPEGGTFQHFLDGVLPKIIQSFDYIRQPQVKILLPPIRDEIIYDMLEKLNISKSKISFDSRDFTADYLLYTCITPPLHPLLWRRARYLQGASDTILASEKDSKIVIVTRDGCKNCDRNLLNMDALVIELQTIYSRERVHVFRRPYSLNRTVELFSKTKVVIGVHGGGLYNIDFCPKGTVVIEIMPTYSNGKTIAAADTIIWTQSVLLGHQYWRLPTPPINYLGDVVVNITLVKQIIKKSNLNNKPGHKDRYMYNR